MPAVLAVIDQTVFLDIVQEGRSIDKERALESAALSSRKAGGRLGQGQAKENNIVVVDMRESRSELLFALHDRGLEVVPMTLEVSDLRRSFSYTLSHQYCRSEIIFSVREFALSERALQICSSHLRQGDCTRKWKE